MDGKDGKSTADAHGELLACPHLGDALTALGSALNERRHLPHQHLNIAGLSPRAFQRPQAHGFSSLQVPWKTVLSLPIDE